MKTANIKRTTRHARIFVLVLLAAFVAGTGCSRNKSYWPLEKGNFWQYGLRIKEGRVMSSLIYEVTSVQGSGNNKVVVVQVRDGDTGNVWNELNLAVTPKGIYETGKTYPVTRNGEKAMARETVDVTSGQFPFIMTPKPEVGQQWNFSYVLHDHEMETEKTINGTGKVLEQQRLSLEVGEFKALKIQMELQNENGLSVGRKLYWFRRGVGPVKIEEQSAAGNAVLMLQKAKIGRKKLGRWK